MKLNIKGLVFVGFAAAVFASAANAAGEEKTVTSLKYTEATYQAKTAANQADKVLKMASNTAGDIGYATVDTTVTADSPNLITSGAVASYVDTAGDNFQTLPGTNDGQKVAKAGGGWEALDTDTTPTSGSTKPVTSGGVATALSGKQDVALVTTLDNADNTHYPSAKAVADAITATADDYQAKSTSTEKQYVANGAGGWEALETDTTPTSGSTKPVTSGGVATALSGKQDAALVTTIDSSSDNTHYPSARAVYDLTNGITIPAPDAGTCGTNAPCALVLENGTASWEPIQQ